MSRKIYPFRNPKRGVTVGVKILCDCISFIIRFKYPKRRVSPVLQSISSYLNLRFLFLNDHCIGYN